MKINILEQYGLGIFRLQRVTYNSYGTVIEKQQKTGLRSRPASTLKDISRHCRIQ